MSKFFESIFNGVAWCVTFSWLIGLLFVGNYLWNKDWSFLNGGDKDKTEKWMNLEKEHLGYCNLELDDDWAAFTSSNLAVNGKMRRALVGGNNCYDFAFKVNVKLTEPKLKTGLEDKIVESYQFDFTFYFIDEDGFIMHTIKPNECFSLKHEEHENYIEWTNEKYPNKYVEATSEAIAQNMISEEIAKRVFKIVYRPTLNAVIKNKKEASETEKEDFWSRYAGPEKPMPSSFRKKIKQ